MGDMEHRRFIYPVGQGGFSVERLEDFVVVFDCGSVSSPQVVEKWINELQKRTNHVNVLFISHFDNDHVNSIRYLLSKIKVLKAVTAFIPKELRTAYSVYTNGAYTSIMGMLTGNDVETEYVGDGEVSNKRFFHREVWEWIAKSMMSPVDFGSVKAILQNQKNIVLRQLEESQEYLESKRQDINDAFKVVFGPKGPNSKGLIVLSQKCKDIETQLSLIYQGCEWCHKSPSRLASFQSSCLYVGDADLKNRSNKKDVKDFLNKYRSERSLMLMQIPHHGSKYNVGALFEMDFSTKYYFVNDITVSRIQANTKLYNSLMGQNKLLYVGDQCQDMIVTETKIK